MCVMRVWSDLLFNLPNLTTKTDFVQCSALYKTSFHTITCQNSTIKSSSNWAKIASLLQCEREKIRVGQN